MTADEAKVLQKKWGDKPCDHPGVMLDQDTGMPRCIRCDRLVDISELSKPRNKGGGKNKPPSAHS